jgi:hypothetical protein
VLLQPQPQLVAVCTLQHVLHESAVDFHVDLQRSAAAIAPKTEQRQYLPHHVTSAA